MPRLPFDGSFAVSQKFGEEHPRYSRWGLAGHNGRDYALPSDVTILAPVDGEIWEVESDPAGYGYYIKIRTTVGEDWLLGHLRLWGLPRPGEWVAEGQPLGWSDDTGESTGPHLHLAYRRDWWQRGWPYNGYADPPI